MNSYGSKNFLLCNISVNASPTCGPCIRRFPNGHQPGHGHGDLCLFPEFPFAYQRKQESIVLVSHIFRQKAAYYSHFTT